MQKNNQAGNQLTQIHTKMAIKMEYTCSICVLLLLLLLLLLLFLASVTMIPGLKIRKILKKLGMSNNPCSHELANCHAMSANLLPNFERSWQVEALGNLLIIIKRPHLSTREMHSVEMW